MKYLLKQWVDLKNVTDTASFYWKQTGGFCADKKMKCNKMYTVWYITAKKKQKITIKEAEHSLHACFQLVTLVSAYTQGLRKKLPKYSRHVKCQSQNGIVFSLVWKQQNDIEFLPDLYDKYQCTSDKNFTFFDLFQPEKGRKEGQKEGDRGR